MSDLSALRLLEVIRRELSATDARFELGGEPPAAGAVWVPLAGAWRVVALFAHPPPDAELRRERLRGLVESFAQSSHLPQPLVGQVSPAARLDDELEALAERCGAVGAVVVEGASATILGSSERLHGREPVEALLDRAVARVAEAIAAEAHGASSLRLLVREEGFGCASRAFAGTYHAVLAFDHPFSALHAEGALLRAIPRIERLVLALPPVDPGGGRVVRLPAALRPV